jgi:hypothetical protein
MYFRTFQEESTLNLSPEIILTVEYLTTQILVNADSEYLREVIEKRTLIDALHRELSFFGYIQKALLPAVKEYLDKHAPALTEVATLLMNDPQNQGLREHLLTPLTTHSG